MATGATYMTLDENGFQGLSVPIGPGGGDDRWAVHGGPAGRIGVVADGHGGTPGAAQAAQTLVTDLVGRLVAGQPDPGYFCSQIMEGDRGLADRATGALASMVLVQLTRNHLMAASVGDAEVWIQGIGQVHRLSGRRKHGSGFEIGTGCAMPEFACLPRHQVRWVALLTDGAVRFTPAGLVIQFLGDVDPIGRWRTYIEEKKFLPDDDLTVLVTKA